MALLALAVYANSLANGFITDDQFQVLHNPVVTGARSLSSAFGEGVWTFLGYRGNYFRPLQFIVYGLVYRAFGPTALPLHLLMVLLHAVNSALVYRLVRRLLDDASTASAAASWVAAALFAVHPIHTEAVNWIAALPDVMVTTFVLTGFSAFVAQKALPTPRQAALHISLYLAALLTKETGVTMLLLYAGYHWIRGSRRNWALYSGMALALGLYLAMRIHSLGSLGHPQQFYRLSAPEFLLSAAVLAAHYFVALVWPVGLNFYHVFHPAGGSLETAVALLVLVAIVWIAWRLRRREPLAIFALFWIAAAIAPALNITGVGQNVFAERYLYLPSVGFALLTALLWNRCSLSRTIWGWAAAIAILLTFSAQSFARNFEWKDDLTLLRTTLPQSPDSGYLHNLMAGVWVQRDQFARALEEARLAVQCEPRAPVYRKNLGNILLPIDPAGAAREFAALVVLQPDLAEGHFDLALAYRAMGDAAHAAAEFRRAAIIDPRYSQPLQ